MIFLKLISVFFKIGLFTIGGGLAMLPIIQHELEAHGWMTHQEFLDILGVAEITPGPISVNSATFVGYRVSLAAEPNLWWFAIVGAFACTIAVCLPSLLCVSALAEPIRKNRNGPFLAGFFSVMKPLVAGLVFTAAGALVGSCLWPEVGPWLERFGTKPDFFALAVAAAAFSLSAFTRVSPVLILFGGMAAGALWGMIG